MADLEQVIAELNKKYKKPIIRKGTEMIFIERIPFPSPRLNYMTYGGIPLGRATEVFGPESGGKTTTALAAAGSAQKLAYSKWRAELDSKLSKLAELKEKNNKTDQRKILDLEDEVEALQKKGPKKVAYFDLEGTLDEEWAELLGVDTDDLILCKPDDETAEQVLQMVLDMMATGDLIMLVIDSLPMLVPQALYEEELDKKTYGGISAVVTEFCRKVTQILSKTNTALVIINQTRENFENPYDRHKTPGGRALKHLYGLRLFLRKGAYIGEGNKELKMKEAEEPIGNLVDVEILKTKVCKPNRRIGFYTLNYTIGIDVVADTVDLAIKYGLVVQSSSWFAVMVEPGTGEVLRLGDKDVKFQGMPKLLEFLRSDEGRAAVFDDLDKKVYALTAATDAA